MGNEYLMALSAILQLHIVTVSFTGEGNQCSLPIKTCMYLFQLTTGRMMPSGTISLQPSDSNKKVDISLSAHDAFLE